MKIISITKKSRVRVGVLVGALVISLTALQVPASHAVTQLRFSALGWWSPSLAPVIAQWNKENPDIQITVDTMGGDTISDIVKNLSAQALAGNAPDLYNDADVFNDQLADNGFGENLVKWFGKGIYPLRRTDFNARFLSSYIPINFPKQVTGLPIPADAVVVYYNKSLFAKANVALPKAGWTYDEYLATCVKLSKWGATQNPQVWGAGSGPSIWQAYYNPFLNAMGTYTYDRNNNTSAIGSKTAVSAFKQLIKPFKNGCFPKFSIISGKSVPTFEGGQIAMASTVRALLPTYRDALKAKGMDWDVVDMPIIKVKGVSKYIIGGGSYGLGMSATSKNKEAAWKFISWFYTAKGGGLDALQLAGNLVPPTDAGIKSGSWRTLAGPPSDQDVFGRAVNNSFIAPKLPGHAATVLDEAITAALQEVLLKKVSVAEAFKTAEDKVTAALEKELDN